MLIIGPELIATALRLCSGHICLQLGLSAFAVSFCSSCYSGGLASMSAELHLSTTVAILGVSLYVLGFGLGPLVFAPLGELYGRVSLFVPTTSRTPVG